MRWQHCAGLPTLDHGEVVLVLPHLGEAPVSLSGTGLACWRQLHGRTTREVIDQIARDYGVATEAIAEPVEGFLSQLQEIGVIEAVNETSGIPA